MWIKKGAYLPFHETLGGHRTLVIYITSHLIYGKEPPKISPTKDRRITKDDLDGDENYIKLLKKYECKHTIIKHI